LNNGILYFPASFVTNLQKMKASFFVLILLLVAGSGFGQKKKNPANPSANYSITLDSIKWKLPPGKAEFYQKNGQQFMKLKGNQGGAVLRDAIFKDGTIEFDFEPYSPMSIGSSPAIYFRGDTARKNTELFYVRARPNNPFANDAIQYAPILNNVNMWDMYPEYQAPVMFEVDKVNHLKMVVSGNQMRVYINEMRWPSLEIPKLEGNLKEGILSLDGQVIISNFIYKPGVTEDLPSVAGPDQTNHDANYLRTWHITKLSDLPAGKEVTIDSLPKPERFIETIMAEGKGMVNLSRKFGGGSVVPRSVVWLKTTIKAAEAQKNLLNLGFSDDVWVFVNGQMVYLDKNDYRQPPMRKYPDGRISIQNGRFNINLKQGDNEIVVAVANDFYGWGLIARLENMEGISY
jgi:hypothetical protein